MKRTSTTYKTAIKNNRIFHHKAVIDYVDGTHVEPQDNELFLFQVKENTSGTGSFDIGSAISKELVIKLDNINNKYGNRNFSGAIIKAYAGLELSNSIEWIYKGTFYAEPGEESGNSIQVKAYDKMVQFDRPYSESNLLYPTTVGEIIRDACGCCEVSLSGDCASLPGYDTPVNKKPETNSLTFRDIIQMAAQILCKNAYIDASEKLNFRWYNTSLLESTEIENSTDAIILNDAITGKFTTDNITITGVRVVDNDTGTAYQLGTDEYILKIASNELIQHGAGESVCSRLAAELIGIDFCPMTLKAPSDPAYEAGDIGIATDQKGQKRRTIFTGVTYSAYAGTELICGAETPYRQKTKRDSAATQIYREVRANLQRQKTEWEKALEDLTAALEESKGLFTIRETLADGSEIIYLADSPTLETAVNMIKLNANGWAVSNNGGKSWTAGMTVDGTMLTKILNTIGLNADWINTGAITVKDTAGNVMFRADYDTGQVDIVANSVVIKGKSVQEIAENEIDNFISAVYDPAISSIQDQIDGNITTFYYDYEPTLNNIPATEWTTETERLTHQGDLFFNKTTGVAYRFMKSDNNWSWQLVKDTDITKALADAKNAQDTADGKRRVFLNTPIPPYDPGDLWAQGENGELMRCINAKSAGAAFVSSDWEKATKYTDDTVALEALGKAEAAAVFVIQMSNEYQGIPTDHQGNYSSFPSCKTKVQAFLGQKNVTESAVWSISKSSGITGSWNSTTKEYTVTGLSTDSGYVEITATYAETSTAKRFDVAKIKGGAEGTAGKGVTATEVKYQASSSGTTTPTGTWQSSVPTVAKGNYLWTRTKITYSDGEVIESYSVAYIGSDGQKGDTGKGISSTEVRYQKGTSGTTVPTGTWQTSIPSTNPGDWLWTRTVITYTDNTSTTSYSVAKVGENGDKGDKGDKGDTGAAGRGISSVTEHYLATASGSGVTTSTSGWTTTVQTMTAINKYLWNYETINYTSGASTNTAPVIIGTYGQKGDKGDTGATGKGIKTITNYYLATSATSVTTSTSGWTTTVQSTTTTNKYLWNYEVITYTDDTTYTSTPHVIGTHGATGESGRTYFLQASADVLKQSVAGAFTPVSTTFAGYYRNGTTASRVAYSGRFIIQETTDGSTWTSKYTSSANESSKAWAPSSTNVKSIRCYMYAAGGTSNALDVVTVPILKDLDNLTQTAVFDALTNNGTEQGLYLKDGKCYTNASYIQSGILKGKYIDAKEISVKNASNVQTFLVDANGNVSINANALSIGGVSAATVNFVAEQTAKNSGNLLKCAEFDASTFSTYWDLSGTLTRGQSDPTGGTGAVKLQGTNTDGYISAKYSTNNPIRNAGQYEVRVWLKASAAKTIKISFNRVTYDCALTTAWKQFKFNVPITTPSTSNAQNFTIGGWGSIVSGNIIYAYMPEVSFSYTPAEVLSMLTNNGNMDVIHMMNNQLYVKGKYIDVDDLKAIGATIGGFTIGTNGIYKGTTGISSNTAGVFIGTTGIRLYKDSDHNFTYNASSGALSLVGGTFKLGNGILQAASSAMAVKYGFHIYNTPETFSDDSQFFKIFNLVSGSGTTLVLGSNNMVYKQSSSSKRYKNHVKEMDIEEAERILDIPVVWFKYKEGYLDHRCKDVGREIPGFYAEDVEKAFPPAVLYNDNDTVEDWNHRTMLPAVLKVMQEMKKEINQLKNSINKLERIKQ